MRKLLLLLTILLAALSLLAQTREYLGPRGKIYVEELADLSVVSPLEPVTGTSIGINIPALRIALGTVAENQFMYGAANGAYTSSNVATIDLLNSTMSVGTSIDRVTFGFGSMFRTYNNVLANLNVIGPAFVVDKDLHVGGNIQWNPIIKTDANTFIEQNNGVVVLPTLTANRTLTLPGHVNGYSFWIYNTENTAFDWQVQGDMLYDIAGNPVTTLVNRTSYYIIAFTMGSVAKYRVFLAQTFP